MNEIGTVYIKVVPSFLSAEEALTAIIKVLVEQGDKLVEELAQELLDAVNIVQVELDSE